MIRLRVRTTDNTDAVKRKVDAASYKSTGHAAASIRMIARRSIRRRKTASQPGQAPHTQTGTLKNSIRYERDGDDVVIGPVNEFGGRLWDRLEFGGTFKKARTKLKATQFKIGDFGPIRKGRIDHRVTKSGRRITTRYNSKLQRIRLRTAAQVTRANRLIAEENEQREQQSRETATYEPRPFMGPALATARPRIPMHWRNSVK